MIVERAYSNWMFLVYGCIRDGSKGLREEGLPAGVRWTAVPPDRPCRECGTRKKDFEMVEI